MVFLGFVVFSCFGQFHSMAGSCRSTGRTSQGRRQKQFDLKSGDDRKGLRDFLEGLSLIGGDWNMNFIFPYNENYHYYPCAPCMVYVPIYVYPNHDPNVYR